MNIFHLSENPKESARMLADKHIVKMIVESCQMLANPYYTSLGIFTLKGLTTVEEERVVKVFDGFPRDIPYRISHIYHPSSMWVYGSLSNWYWLLLHVEEMLRQYTLRYCKFHACSNVVDWYFSKPPDIEDVGLTEFAQAMPDEYKDIDPVVAYRNYYIGEKKWAKWKMGDMYIPKFYRI